VKALSGRQPWWWAILHAGKRIENRVMVVRGRRCPPTWHRYRGPILLHASKGCTKEYFRDACIWMEQAGVVPTTHPMTIDDMQRGGIIGRARIVGVIAPGDDAQAAAADADIPDLDLRWWMRDQYGFVLVDVEPLPFVPYPGSLGLFEIPEATLRLFEFPEANSL
jgi:hypothetical protein